MIRRGARRGYALRPLCWAAGLVAWLSALPAWAVIPSDALLERLKPQGAVNDFAGLLNPAERSAIDQRIQDLRAKTSAQFALVTLKSMEGGQIDDFTNKLFKKWGVGEKGKNNGVVLLVAIQDRKARIEVGYGLEPILPDALAGRVLDEHLFPAFKQQRYGEGLRAAVDRIAQIIERGEPAPAEARRANDRPPVLFVAIFVALGFGAIGAGLGTRKVITAIFLGLWGVGFGGLPLLFLWREPGIGLYILIAVAAAAFIGGWKLGRLAARSAPGTKRWKTSATESWYSGWTWGGSDWSSSGGGGGFSGGGGGFGGGSSGGGGASGGW